MGDPVKELEFEGVEKDFKSRLNSHFAQDVMVKREKEEMSKKLMESAKGAEEEQISRAVELSQSCEIVSLTLPIAQNGYQAVNAYVDNVGRVKQLQKNARASRITSTDIRGDCFMSRTVDDEETFKRIDFTMNDYEIMMEAPPSAEGRWDQSEALLKLQKQLQEKSHTTEPRSTEPPHCHQCYKKEGDVAKLMKCGRCGKVSFNKA